jgi:hypothetical protein
MPANNDYIPQSDAEFNDWSLNFSAKLTASPGTYGLVAADAVAVAASLAVWSPAYAAATAPASRTPVTIAAKTSARAALTALARPLAVKVSLNPSVSSANKIALGVTARSGVRTPITAPTVSPALTLLSATPGQLNISYADPSTPDTKAVPDGCAGVELFVAFGNGQSLPVTSASYVGRATKTPTSVSTAGQSGKTVTLYGRFVTRSGSGGKALESPFSMPLITVAI